MESVIEFLKEIGHKLTPDRRVIDQDVKKVLSALIHALVANETIDAGFLEDLAGEVGADLGANVLDHLETPDAAPATDPAPVAGVETSADKPPIAL